MFDKDLSGKIAADELLGILKQMVGGNIDEERVTDFSYLFFLVKKIQKLTPC